jgi:hypothetical protein
LGANPVGGNESIGRNRSSTDNNGPYDWDDSGGSDASIITKGSKNLGKIVINEIMYMPSSGEEWVEIYYNGTNLIVNLTGWSLTDKDGENPNNNITFPSWDFLPNSYLVVHLGVGTNDSDFSDGTGHLYTGITSAALDDSEDQLGLYSNCSQSPAGIIDFIAWDTDSDHSSDWLIDDDDAINGGIWNEGDYFNSTEFLVESGESIGRDRYSTDTDKPEDWMDHGGVDVIIPPWETQGFQNYRVPELPNLLVGVMVVLLLYLSKLVRKIKYNRLGRIRRFRKGTNR